MIDQLDILNIEKLRSLAKERGVKGGLVIARR